MSERREWSMELTASVLEVYLHMALAATNSGSEVAFKGALQLILDELVESEYLAKPPTLEEG